MAATPSSTPVQSTASLRPGEEERPEIYVRVRRVRPFRWRWHLTAGEAGPTIYGPFYALTLRGAYRAAHAAFLARAER